MSEQDITLPVTPEERQRIENIARRRGYAAVSDYLRDLLQQDAITHGEPEPFAEDEPSREVILERLRRSILEARRGDTLPLSALDELDDELIHHQMLHKNFSAAEAHPE